MEQLLRRAERSILKNTGQEVILFPLFKSSVNPHFTVQFILDTVCEVYDIRQVILKSECKPNDVVHARWTCMLLMKRFFPKISLKRIGAHFSMHHTTVMYGIEHGNKLLETQEDAYFISRYSLIVQKLIKKYNEIESN